MTIPKKCKKKNILHSSYVMFVVHLWSTRWVPRFEDLPPLSRLSQGRRSSRCRCRRCSTLHDLCKGGLQGGFLGCLKPHQKLPRLWTRSWLFGQTFGWEVLVFFEKWPVTIRHKTSSPSDLLLTVGMGLQALFAAVSVSLMGHLKNIEKQALLRSSSQLPSRNVGCKGQIVKEPARNLARSLEVLEVLEVLEISVFLL